MTSGHDHWRSARPSCRLAEVPAGIQYSKRLNGDGAATSAHVCKPRCEGIVSKRRHRYGCLSRCASMRHQFCRNSRCGFWAPNDAEHLFAGATNYNSVPINRWPNDLKFGRNRVHHKCRLPRRRTNILRNGRLSASAAFRTNQGNSGLVGHPRSMGWWITLTLPEFCSLCSIYVLGNAPPA